MENNRTSHRVVSVGLDDSECSRHALAWAAGEAARRGAELHLVHAVRPVSATEAGWLSQGGVSLVEFRAEAMKQGQKLLEEANGVARAEHATLPIRATATVGDPREVLLAEASRADLLVVGSRGHGPVRTVLLGSTGVALVRHSPTPVVVVRRRQGDAGEGVVVGIEATRDSTALLRAAFAEAEWRHVPVSVVSCRWTVDEPHQWVDWTPDPVKDVERLEAIEKMLAAVRADYPQVDIRVRHTRGRADRCLIDLGAGVELLVVGRRAATALDQIGLGSMASVIVEHARGNVLVVPTEGG